MVIKNVNGGRGWLYEVCFYLSGSISSGNTNHKWGGGDYSIPRISFYLTNKQTNLNGENVCLMSKSSG